MSKQAEWQFPADQRHQSNVSQEQTERCRDKGHQWKMDAEYCIRCKISWKDGHA